MSSDLFTLKRLVIGGLTLIALPLVGYFVLVRHDLNGFYLPTLSFVSAALIIKALPRLRLGLSAAYLFVMPLLLYSGNTSYSYTKIIGSLVVLSLLLVLWAVDLALQGEYRIDLTGLFWPGLGLLGVGLLSLINSQVFWGDFQYVVLLLYFFCFALLTANTIETRGDLRLLLGALLAAGALASLYGLLQYYGALPGRPGYTSGAGVILSTLGNKNYFAGLLAYLFAPGLLLFLSKTPFRIKMLTLLGLALLYLGLLAADSYSGWLAVTASLALLLVGLWIYRGENSLRENLSWINALLALLVLTLLFYALTTTFWVQNAQAARVPIRSILASTAPAWGILLLLALLASSTQISSLFAKLSRQRRTGVLMILLMAIVGLGVVGIRWGSGSVLKPILSKVTSASLGVRLEEWQMAYLMFRDRPLIGAGIGEYKRQYLFYKAQYLQTPQGRELNASIGYNPRPVYAHNEYIQIAAEMGLIGLLASALLILMIFWSTLRRIRRSDSPEDTFMLLVLLGGVIAFLSDAFFSFPLHLPANALVLAFLLGALYAPALGARTREVHLRPVGGLALTGFIVALALVVSGYAVRDFQADVALSQGKSQFLHGNYQGAMTTLQRSVSLSVSPSENLAWLARTYQALANASSDIQARRSLEELSIHTFERSLISFDVELTYYQLALLFVQRAQYEEAERYLAELLAAGPAPHLQADAQYLQILIVFRRQGGPSALEPLQKFIEAYPDYERARILLAQYQAQQGQYGLAKQTLTAVRELITKKLMAVNQILHPTETTTVSTDDYYQAKADEAQLQQEQAAVDKLLQGLP